METKCSVWSWIKSCTSEDQCCYIQYWESQSHLIQTVYQIKYWINIAFPKFDNCQKKRVCVYVYVCVCERERNCK